MFPSLCRIWCVPSPIGGSETGETDPAGTFPLIVASYFACNSFARKSSPQICWLPFVFFLFSFLLLFLALLRRHLSSRRMTTCNIDSWRANTSAEEVDPYWWYYMWFVLSLLSSWSVVQWVVCTFPSSSLLFVIWRYCYMQSFSLAIESFSVANLFLIWFFGRDNVVSCGQLTTRSVCRIWYVVS